MREKAIYMSESRLLQYVALDRMDVVFATKEVRSRTTSGKELGWTSRDCDKKYPYQGNASQIDCYTDADWAGDVPTRLSTTAGALMHGAHWLEGWSVSQKVRALSRAEENTRAAL